MHDTDWCHPLEKPRELCYHSLIMAKKGNRQLIVLKNPDTGTLYYTRKNAVQSPDPIKLKKYDKAARKVATFVESKVKLG